MPWGYAADTGIVKKWADKYGITIEVKQFNDYVESINQYTAGAFDAVTLTNMDALSIPAAGGVDTTAVIVGDFSNGNDAVILKDKDKLADIKGQNVNLVEFSVSHYLLARALESIKLAREGRQGRQHLRRRHGGRLQDARRHRRRDLEPDGLDHPRIPDAKKVFDSSQIPGEIIDLMVANTEVLKDNPKFGKALAGIWYDTMATMKSGNDVEGVRWRRPPAPTSRASKRSSPRPSCSPTPKDAVAFTTGGDLKTTTERVSKFLFDKALLGKDAKTDGRHRHRVPRQDRVRRQGQREAPL